MEGFLILVLFGVAVGHLVGHRRADGMPLAREDQGRQVLVRGAVQVLRPEGG